MGGGNKHAAARRGDTPHRGYCPIMHAMSATEVFLLAILIIFTLPYAVWRLGRTDYWAPLVVVQCRTVAGREECSLLVLCVLCHICCVELKYWF